MTIQEDVTREAAAMDARFDQAQPELIAKLRRAGVSEAEMPEALGEAHALYWKERNALLDQLADALAEVERLSGEWRRRIH